MIDDCMIDDCDPTAIAAFVLVKALLYESLALQGAQHLRVSGKTSAYARHTAT
jgi:hypothetical protein